LVEADLLGVLLAVGGDATLSTPLQAMLRSASII
jgi:hypothetical protein